MKTLDELKAMSDSQLFNLWGAAQFPFETMPCGTCMTGHHLRYGGCHDPAHHVLIERITAMSPNRLNITGILTKDNVEEFLALRLYHDDQYAPEKQVGALVPQQVKDAKVTING